MRSQKHSNKLHVPSYLVTWMAHWSEVTRLGSATTHMRVMSSHVVKYRIKQT